MLTHFLLPADLPQGSDDFEPSMDANVDDAFDEFMEEESVPPVVEEGIL
ncbi:hypothetical protein PSU51_20845 [Yersinia pestis]|nr:hypothetical protein [Yersinia pestis]